MGLWHGGNFLRLFFFALPCLKICQIIIGIIGITRIVENSNIPSGLQNVYLAWLRGRGEIVWGGQGGVVPRVPFWNFAVGPTRLIGQDGH